MQGILAIKTAEAEGLGKLLACARDPELVKYYLALEKDLFNNVAGRLPLISLLAKPDLSTWRRAFFLASHIGRSYPFLQSQACPHVQALPNLGAPTCKAHRMHLLRVPVETSPCECIARLLDGPW